MKSITSADPTRTETPKGFIIPFRAQSFPKLKRSFGPSLPSPLRPFPLFDRRMDNKKLDWAARYTADKFNVTSH